MQKCDIRLTGGSKDFNILKEVIAKHIGEYPSHTVVKVQISKGMKHDCEQKLDNCGGKAPLRIVRITNQGKFYANYICVTCFRKIIQRHVSDIQYWGERVKGDIMQQVQEKADVAKISKNYL